MKKDLAMFNRAMEFAKNKRPHGGLSNIYVAQTINRDGEVTSETYGMNMFTDYGFGRYFANTINWPRNVYVGGAQTTDQSLITTQSIFEKITADSDDSTLRNTTIDYAYPMYYYPQGNDGIITCICKFQESTFPWNLSDVGEDITITEYGIGESIDQLWTHSWVYDITGAKASIIKHPNEKLEMTIYFCLTYKVSLITNNHANDIYTTITTLQRFLSNNRMDDTTAGILRRNSNAGFTKLTSQSDYNNKTDDDHVYINTNSTVTNRHQSKFTSFHPFNMYKNSGNYNGYFNGFYTHTNGFQVLSPEKRTAYESFDIIGRSTYAVGFHNTCIADRFGDETNELPFTQVDMSNVYLYNRFTGEYDNPVSFTNDPAHEYSEASFKTNLANPIYYTNIDHILNMYVYQNTNTSDPIDQFSNVDIGSIYATDEYWNINAWEPIQNPFNIQQSLKTKKYYITNSNTNQLNPIRHSGEFTLAPRVAQYKSSLSFNDYGPNRQSPFCENYTRGYFVRANNIYIPNTSLVFQIGSNLDIPLGTYAGVADTKQFCYGNIVITFPYSTLNDGRYYITNLDNMSDPYSVYKSITGTEGYTSFNANIKEHSFITQSSTGLICLQRIDTVDESVVIDLSSRIVGAENQFVQKRFESTIACAIYSTNAKKRVAYVPTSDPLKLEVYDFDDETVIESFDLPTGSATPKMIWALNDYIWITDGSTWSRVYSIGGSSTGETCTNNMTLVSSDKSILQHICMTAVSDVILIYRCNGMSSSGQAFFTRADKNQSTIYNLSDFSYQSGTYYQYFVVMDLRYIEDGKTLVLNIGNEYYYNNNTGNRGAWTTIIDFGQYINPSASTGGVAIVDQFTNPTIAKNRGICMYGENLITGYEDGTPMMQIPISNMLKHRLVGKTKTHSTVNTIIHVDGKLITTAYSNTAPGDYPESGYPPGSQN